jgi:hypothetical protein
MSKPLIFESNPLRFEHVLEMLEIRKGDRSWKQLAEEMECSPQYLCDVIGGRREPGPKILEPLGLIAETIYVFVKARSGRKAKP